MKLISFAFIAMAFSMSVHAIEDGEYLNHQHTSADPLLYRSLRVSTGKCQGSAGAVINFYGADSMNFCVGSVETSVFKYKKCIGKEVNEFPFKVCLGVKKTVEMSTTKEVVQDAVSGTITRIEKQTDDGQLVFQQHYSITEEGQDGIKVQYSFESLRDGRSGTTTMLFEKQN